MNCQGQELFAEDPVRGMALLMFDQKNGTTLHCQHCMRFLHGSEGGFSVLVLKKAPNSKKRIDRRGMARMTDEDFNQFLSMVHG